MSGRFAWEREIRDSDLPPNTRFVMLTMGTYMDRDGFARPSQETLAAATGLSTRAVRRNIHAAIEAGWLAKLRQGRHAGRGGSFASEYQAVVPVAGGQEWPTADDSDPVDNPSQEDSSGLLGISQEDARCPQPATSGPAGGQQCPPFSMNTSISPHARCTECDGSGWIPATLPKVGDTDNGWTQGVARCKCARAKTA